MLQVSTDTKEHTNLNDFNEIVPKFIQSQGQTKNIIIYTSLITPSDKNKMHVTDFILMCHVLN